MKYMKAHAEIVEFDNCVFMQDSPGYGHTCGNYTKGVHCSSWTTTSFGGGSCTDYDGHKCDGYTDNTHNNCSEFGITCGKF